MAPTTPYSYTSKVSDVQNMNIDTLKERFKEKFVSVDQCVKGCHVEWTNRLNSLFGLFVSVGAAVGQIALQRFIARAQERGLNINAANPRDLEMGAIGQNAPVLAAAAAAGANGYWKYVGRALFSGLVKEGYHAIGDDIVKPILQDAIDNGHNSFYNNITHQMAIITVVNETRYTFELANKYNMIEDKDSPRATFSELHPRIPGEDSDRVAWGFWSTGSGWVSGAASAIEIKTTHTPDGAVSFYFIVAAACPAWTSKNTMALEMNQKNVQAVCEANEKASADEKQSREVKSPDGKVVITAITDGIDKPWCHVCVRIKETQLALFNH